jgi:GGDEF domain-containing protein
MDVLDPITNIESDGDLGGQILINQLKTGDVLGEMGFLRSVPRSATVVATSPVELLQINWKMIKRLQWLYPPTAHKFFFNLMKSTCDRLENLTECFAEIKMLDDSTGLCNKSHFLKVLDTEIQRARCCCTDLSLGYLKFSFDDGQGGSSSTKIDKTLQSIGEMYSSEIHKWDTLSRYGRQSFALLMPQSSIEEAQDLCRRLKRIAEERFAEPDGLLVTLDFGLAELALVRDETGADLLARATAVFQNAS